MKNKITAAILAFVMIITLFMPITVLAANDSAEITLAMGTPQKKTVDGKDYIAVPIEVSGNSHELFVLSYNIMSKDGLTPYKFEDGTIEYGYEDAFGESVSITMNTNETENTYEITQRDYTGYKVLMDSSSGTEGLLTQSGNVGTAWFEISKQLETYTFALESLGADYTFDVSGGKRDTAKYTVTVGGNVTYSEKCQKHNEVVDTANSKAATCTADGLEVTKCSICGIEVSRKVINRLGHNLTADTANSKAATCGTRGIDAKKCTRCSYTEAKSVAATGNHTIASGKCSVCGFVSGTPEISVSFGTPVKKTVSGKNYIAIPVEMTGNANELFALSYRIMSKEGLTPYKFENGTIKYEYQKSGSTVTVTMDTSIGKNPSDITALGYTGYRVLMDSSSGTEGLLAQSGNMGTVWFALPEGEATYNFIIESLGANCLIDDANGKPQVIKYAVKIGDDLIYTTGCLKHTEVADTANSKAATCTEEGLQVTKCSTCGIELLRKVLNKLDHTEVADTANSKAATCTTDGAEVTKCSVCGIEISRTIINMLGHTEVADTANSKAATCTTAGVKVTKCSTCGEELSRTTIAKLGHKEVADTANSKAATCTTDGVKVTKCSTCGTELSRTTLTKLGHNMVADTANSKEATCVESGVEATKCTRCSHTETKTIAATGNHTIVSGVCSVCGLVVENPEINVSFGTPVQSTINGKNYVAIPVEMTGNASELFVLSYRVMSKEGLTPYKFENGTIKYEYKNASSSTVTITMDTSIGKNPSDITALGYTGYRVLMDSSSGSEGLLTQSGNVGTIWFELPDSAGTFTFIIEGLGANCIVDDANGDPQVIKYTVKVGNNLTFKSTCLKHTEVKDTVNSKAATCTTAGVAVTKCSACGEELSRTTIAKLGHNMVADAENSKAATCTETGIEAKKCTRCDHTEETVIAKLGHTEVKDTVNSKAATCTTDGADVTKCSTCGEELSRKVLTKLGHNMVADEENSKAATCTENGVEAKKCTRCDHTEETVIAKLGHKEVVDTVNSKKPTCTEDGADVTKCSTCGEELSRVVLTATGHTEVKDTVNSKAATCTTAGVNVTKCSVCGTELSRKTIANLGHNMVADEENSKEPTCTETGIEAKKCTRCDHTEETVIAKLGHKEVVDTVNSKKPTCTEDGADVTKCSTCGEELSRVVLTATGHTEVKDTVNSKAATCTTAGVDVTKCSVCGTELSRKTIAKLGHNMVADEENSKEPTCTETGIEAKKCTRCDHTEEKVIAKLGHTEVKDTVNSKAATCTTDGADVTKCSTCGEELSRVVLKKLGHNMVADAENSKAATCTENGVEAKKCTRCDHTEETVIAKLGHKEVVDTVNSKKPTCTEDGADVTKCSVCGIELSRKVLAATGHTEVKDTENSKAATCTENGAEVTKCSVCGTELSRKVLTKLGHNMVADTENSKAATCTETGIEAKKCTRCDHTEEKVIAKLGHKESGWKVLKEATSTELGIEYKECTVCGETLETREFTIGGNYSDVIDAEGKNFTIDDGSRVDLSVTETPKTIEAVIKAPTSVFERQGTIVGNYEGYIDNQLNLEIYSDGRVRLYIVNNGYYQDCIFNTDIRSDLYTHIAVTLDGSVATLYVNGKKAETKALTVKLPEEIKGLKVGGDNRSGNTQYFKGTIYSVSLFSDVRTADEIKRDSIYVFQNADNLLYSEYYSRKGHTEADVTALNGKTFNENNAVDVSGAASGTPYTFEAIIQAGGTVSGDYGVIVGNKTSQSGKFINLEMTALGKIKLSFNNGSKLVEHTFSKDVRSNGPTHIAVTVNAKTAVLYVNGQKIETATLSASYEGIKDNFKIGGDNTSGNANYFKGKIYAVNMFSDVRTADEIKRDVILVNKNAGSLLCSYYFTDKSSYSEDNAISQSGKHFDSNKLYSVENTDKNSPHTFEAVISLPKNYTERAGVVIGNFTGGIYGQINIEIFSHGKVRLFLKEKNQSFDHIFNTDIRSDSPTHIAITVDGKLVTLYVNGKKAETATLTMELPKTSTGYKIGGDNRLNNTQYFKGTIYSVNLFSDVRTAEEIARDAIAVAQDEDGLVYSAYFVTTDKAFVPSEGKTFTETTVHSVNGSLSSTPYTLEATVYVPPTLEGRAGVVVGNFYGKDNELNVEIFEQGRVRLFIRKNLRYVDYTFSTDIRSSAPVHIAVTIDGKVATLYVNGKAVETATLSMTYADITDDFKIGGDNRTGNTQYFKGKIYTVSLFGDVRTAEEIALDAIGVSDDADALLYNAVFAYEMCDESPLNDGHVESNWITDIEATDTLYGIKHTECVHCGKVIKISEI